MKKFTSLVFFILFTSSLFAFTPTIWTLGDGTPGNPYQISNADELAYLAQQVNMGSNYLGVEFILAADIDLVNSPWTPIGNSVSSFSGHFNGDAHVIKNIKIDASASDCQALFGHIYGATISNLGLENGEVKGKTNVAGLVGLAESSSVITNCYNTLHISGVEHVGGLVGKADNSTIHQSFNTGSVFATTGEMFKNVGGITGYLRGGTIEDCFNSGAISTDSNFLIGGLAGMAEAGATIVNSYNIGMVSGVATSEVGALVGRFQQEAAGTSTITACYFDKQLLPNAKCIDSCHNDNGGVITLTDTLAHNTTDLTNLVGPFGSFVLTPGLYPQNGFWTTSDVAKLAISPITFPVAENVDSVRNAFTVNADNGVVWSCNNPHALIVGTAGTISTMCDGPESAIFTATLNSATKTVTAELKNTYPKYVQSANLTDTRYICPSDLPYVVTPTVTYTQTDFNSANDTIKELVTFQTIHGCDSIVDLTTILRAAPTMEMLTEDHNVISGNTTTIQFLLHGIPPYAYTFNNNGVAIPAAGVMNPVVTFNVGAGDYYLDALSDVYCTALPSGLQDTLHIGTVTEVQVVLAPTSNGTIVDTNPAIVSNGVNVKSYRITPAEGYYLSALERGSTDVKNSVRAENGQLIYSFIPTSDVELRAMFAKAPAWTGGMSAPVANVAGDTLLIYITDELAWVANQANTGTQTFLNKHLILMNDLDLGGVYNPVTTGWSGQEWSPIGKLPLNNRFKGDFDGNGHELSNLYIKQDLDYLGLFGVIGSEATVKNLAIVSGSISGRNQIGNFAGLNAGKLMHCYNMSEIEKGGENVGGLVGRNDGTIKQAYNVGIIYKSTDYAGGIAGLNTGVIDSVYNAGDVNAAGDILGAFAGKNEATGSITNAYFDYQMCATTAVGTNLGTATVVARKTSEMYNIAMFTSDPVNWLCGASVYPQLVGLDGTDAALASVAPIMLKEATADTGIEDVRKVTQNFTVSTVNGSKWSSSNNDWVALAAGNATVTLKCESDKTIILTDSVNNAYKKVQIKLPKLSTFDAGTIDTKNDTTCFGSTNNKIDNVTSPTGGDSKYDYMWIQINAATPTDRDTIYNTVKEFVPTETVPGTYNFERWVKDNTCQLSYIKSAGLWTLVILENFTAGEIEATNDTICGVGAPKTIGSVTDAAEGDKNITYRWKQDDVVIASTNTATYTPTESVAGEYVYTREAKDGRCNTWTKSTGDYRLVIYPVFNPGEIAATNDTVCAGVAPKIINSITDASTGFNTTYIWKCNDIIIAGATAKAFTPPTGMVPGTYTYKRWVTDDKCQLGDTVQSTGAWTLVVYAPFVAGEIQAIDTVLCASDVVPEITEVTAATGGDTNIEYRWLMNGAEIAGATAATLTPDPATMTANVAYEFVRQVKDGRCAPWTNSVGKATMKIYAPFDPGAVVAMNDTLCFTTADGFYDMVLGSATPATGGDGKIEYRWRMRCDWAKAVIDNSGETPVTILVDTTSYAVIGNASATETYQFVRANVQNARFPMTFTFVREAKDTLCSGGWQASTDTVRYIMSDHRATTRNVYICQDDFPFNYTYTYSYDSHTEDVRFFEDGQTFLMNDFTSYGCDYKVTLRAVLCKTPVVEVTQIAPICETESTMQFEISTLAGVPNRYKLMFDDRAKAQGFVDVDYTAIPLDSVIVITKPAAAHAGTYKVFVQFMDARSQYGCESVVDTLVMSISVTGYLHAKWNDIIFVDNQEANEQPAPSESLKFTSYQWYRNGEKIEGATQQFYQQTGGLSGTYYVVLTTTEGLVYRSCDTTFVLAQTVSDVRIKVYPVPARPHQTLMVELPFDELQLSAGYLEVFNSQGMKVYQTNQITEYTSMPAMVVQGVYLVRFTATDGQQYVSKFIVE